MYKCVGDRDLYVLGLKLVELILRTELSISDGYFEATGEDNAAVDLGLPFTRYIEALPECAKVLRAPKDQDYADILRHQIYTPILHDLYCFCCRIDLCCIC